MSTQPLHTETDREPAADAPPTHTPESDQSDIAEWLLEVGGEGEYLIEFAFERDQIIATDTKTFTQFTTVYSEVCTHTEFLMVQALSTIAHGADSAERIRVKQAE